MPWRDLFKLTQWGRAVFSIQILLMPQSWVHLFHRSLSQPWCPVLAVSLFCCCWPGPVFSVKCYGIKLSTLLLMATLHMYTLLYIPIISCCIIAKEARTAWVSRQWTIFALQEAWFFSEKMSGDSYVCLGRTSMLVRERGGGGIHRRD